MMVIPIMVMPQDECAIRRKRFMTWYEAEKKRLSERDENGENWVERLPHCPSKLLKRGDDFISPDENEWTKTWYFGVTQFFGNYHLSRPMIYLHSFKTRSVYEEGKKAVHKGVQDGSLRIIHH